jgi:hypothetical protein
MTYKPLFFFALCVAAWAQTRQHAETAITFRLPAPPAAAFPLFGPVREGEWSPYWKPRFLFPADPSQKAGAVFTTRTEHGETVWTLAVYDEAALRIQYLIVWPGMCATTLDIVLKPTADDASETSVTYRQTALSEAGDKYVREFASDFPTQRDHWQRAISHRLQEIAAGH